MNDLVIKYPLDLTAVNVTNRILGEPHTLNNGINRPIVPRYGTFYLDSLVVRDVDNNQILTAHEQYIPVMYAQEASERSGKEAHAGIIVTDRTVSNNVVIDYQVVGGAYINITQILLELIENLNLDEREVIWGDLLGLPDAFPPASHLHDVGDVYGFEYVTEALEGVRDAILVGDRASHAEIYQHIETRYNENLNRIDANSLAIQTHEGRKDNPHVVTKAQVGLGNVANYSVASTAEADAGTAQDRYMTPALVKSAIDTMVRTDYEAHKNNFSNPHQVTKEQVGLGNVSNYALSSQAHAEAGTVVTSYMTPLRVKQAIDKFAGAMLTTHTADKNNPHAVTKTQVGLSSVDNFASASQAEAEAGSVNNRFMTPLRTKQAITVFAVTPLNAHIARVDNPHAVTKAQVGLGNVTNYSVASTAEAQAGSLNTRYMTPLLVKYAITSQAGAALSAHTSDKNNPHAVTKTQVGLSAIPNSTTRSRVTNSDGALLTAGAMYDHVNSGDHDARYVRLSTAVDTSLRVSSGQLQAYVNGGWRIVWPPQWQ